MRKLTLHQMIALLRAAEHYPITSEALINAMAKLRDGIAHEVDYRAKKNLERAHSA